MIQEDKIWLLAVFLSYYTNELPSNSAIVQDVYGKHYWMHGLIVLVIYWAFDTQALKF